VRDTEARGDLDSASTMESSSFIERWKPGKAHKPRLECIVMQIQQSVNQVCVAFKRI